MGSVFRFKEFEVNQEGCAMKINTDGVLLGAIVHADNPVHILDIGTGTGVIAMMLAQRFHEACLHAVEIDKDAFTLSISNFQNSPYSTRVEAFLGSFEDLHISVKYDLIVSNPPFYTNSLPNADERKKLARHTDVVFFDKLLDFAHQNLADHGQLSLILPVDLAVYVIERSENLGLYLSKSISIKSFADSPVIRNIITLTKSKVDNTVKEDFVIYQKKGVYSTAYRTLLKPYFLAF